MSICAVMSVSSEHGTPNVHPRFDSQLEVCDDVILRTSSIALMVRLVYVVEHFLRGNSVAFMQCDGAVMVQ